MVCYIVFRWNERSLQSDSHRAGILRIGRIRWSKITNKSGLAGRLGLRLPESRPPESPFRFILRSNLESSATRTNRPLKQRFLSNIPSMARATRSSTGFRHVPPTDLKSRSISLPAPWNSIDDGVDFSPGFSEILASEKRPFRHSSSVMIR